MSCNIYSHNELYLCQSHNAKIIMRVIHAYTANVTSLLIVETAQEIILLEVNVILCAGSVVAAMRAISLTRCRELIPGQLASDRRPTRRIIPRDRFESYISVLTCRLNNVELSFSICFDFFSQVRAHSKIIIIISLIGRSTKR